MAMLQTFDTGLPSNTLKWTGGLLLAPKSLHRRNHNTAKQGHREYIDQTCEYGLVRS